VDWVRARSDEQIEQRINEIVEATARLYEENRFEDITIAMIAKEADFTRSNLYRYFETKEDIFLELMKRDIEAWRIDFIERFEYLSPSLHEVSKISVELILKHERMVKLFTILFTLLEPKASLDALRSFKQTITNEVGMVARFLSTKLSFPSVEVAAEYLTAQSSLAIGAYPMMNLTPKQKEAMQTIGEETSPEYYQERLARSIEILLNGYLSRADGNV